MATGPSRKPDSSTHVVPVISPLPFWLNHPAYTGSGFAFPRGKMTVTPVRTGPMPTLSGPLPEMSVVFPTSTPRTSVMAFSGPGVPSNGTPRSRARCACAETARNRRNKTEQIRMQESYSRKYGRKREDLSNVWRGTGKRRGHRVRRQIDPHAGAGIFGIGAVADLDGATMLLHDPHADPKPNPSAMIALRREEGLKEFRTNLGRDTGAVVQYFYNGPGPAKFFRLGGVGANMNFSIRSRSIGSIDNQVGQDLAELCGKPFNGHIISRVLGDFNALVIESSFEKQQHAADHLRNIYLYRCIRLAIKVQQAAADLQSTVQLLLRQLQIFSAPRRVGLLCQQIMQVADRIQGVVNFMRNAGRQASCHGKFFARGQSSFRAAFFRNVTKDENNAYKFSLLVQNGRGAVVNHMARSTAGDQYSVVRKANNLVEPAHFFNRILRHFIRVLIHDMKDFAQQMPRSFVFGPSCQRFRHRVHELDGAIRLADNHRIANRTENRAQLLAPFVQKSQRLPVSGGNAVQAGEREKAQQKANQQRSTQEHRDLAPLQKNGVFQPCLPEAGLRLGHLPDGASCASHQLPATPVQAAVCECSRSGKYTSSKGEPRLIAFRDARQVCLLGRIIGNHLAQRSKMIGNQRRRSFIRSKHARVAGQFVTAKPGLLVHNEAFQLCDFCADLVALVKPALGLLRIRNLPQKNTGQCQKRQDGGEKCLPQNPLKFLEIHIPLFNAASRT